MVSQIRPAVATLLLLGSAVSSAVAQRPEAKPPVAPLIATWASPTQSMSSSTPSTLVVRADTAAVRATHWVKGGVIGGILLGGAFGWFVHGMCESRCGTATLSAAAIGGFAGFIIGALVGGAVPRDTTP